MGVISGLHSASRTATDGKLGEDNTSVRKGADL